MISDSDYASFDMIPLLYEVGIENKVKCKFYFLYFDLCQTIYFYKKLTSFERTAL